MQVFVDRLNPQPGDRIIDLGGESGIWQHVDIPLHVTILNLPDSGINHYAVGPHTFCFLEGDATEAKPLLDNSFDIVFSNSVIEHVGDSSMQSKFASEVFRLAPRYFIQTPSKYFPLEAHTGLPFWWYYPEWLKQYFHRQWKRRIPAWNQMILGTRFLDKNHFEKLFPGCNFETERIASFPKSYIAWRA
jgi:Methyltransferase domain